jgi:hypothetical protein
VKSAKLGTPGAAGFAVGAALLAAGAAATACGAFAGCAENAAELNANAQATLTCSDRK